LLSNSVLNFDMKTLGTEFVEEEIKKGNSIFEDLIISADKLLQIDGLVLKGSLVFKNCIFESSIDTHDIKNRHISITFKNCHFKRDFSIGFLNIDKIELTKVTFDQAVSILANESKVFCMLDCESKSVTWITYCKAQDASIHNCNFENLRLQKNEFMNDLNLNGTHFVELEDLKT